MHNCLSFARPRESPQRIFRGVNGYRYVSRDTGKWL